MREWSQGELLGQTGTRLFAWCLLSNHFHLLVRRGDQPLSLLMRRLMTGHAVRFNLRHSRCGYLFQNRYKSILVEEEEYSPMTVSLEEAASSRKSGESRGSWSEPFRGALGRRSFKR